MIFKAYLLILGYYALEGLLNFFTYYHFNQILSLSGKIRVRDNPCFGIFYAVMSLDLSLNLTCYTTSNDRNQIN